MGNTRNEGIRNEEYGMRNTEWGIRNGEYGMGNTEWGIRNEEDHLVTPSPCHPLTLSPPHLVTPSLLLRGLRPAHGDVEFIDGRHQHGGGREAVGDRND